jgi:flagellar hook-associated protein 2
LAQSLVDAEKLPRQDRLNKQIAKSEAKISGAGAISYVLSELKTKFSNLDDLSDFNSVSVANSQSSAFTATTNSKATSGSHNIEVITLATCQTNVSNGFASPDAPLNGGQAFSISVTVGTGTAQNISVPAVDSTPAGLVAAINAANKGIQAQLVNTGSGATPFTIIFSGQNGAANSFNLNSNDGLGATVSGLDLGTHLQTAANASLRVNGITLSRPSNRVEDAIPGVTLDLMSTTTGAGKLDLNRDTTTIKQRFKDLVTAYNDIITVLNVAGDKESTVEGYGASLVGDSSLQRVKTQVRSIFLNTSSTPASSMTALRDLGLTITRDGTMELSEEKLDTALTNQFESVVKMLSNKRSIPTKLTSVPSGLAGDAVKQLDALLAPTGLLASLTSSAENQIEKQKDMLLSLESRMSKLLTRYTKQFAVMESFVGQTNNLKTSLKSTFDGMNSIYNQN